MVVYDMDCDSCKHSFYEGDKLRCELEFCEPDYPEFEVDDDFEVPEGECDEW